MGGWFDAFMTRNAAMASGKVRLLSVRAAYALASVAAGRSTFTVRLKDMAADLGIQPPALSAAVTNICKQGWAAKTTMRGHGIVVSLVIPENHEAEWEKARADRRRSPQDDEEDFDL